MQHAELMVWRKALRGGLLARRQAVSADQLQLWRIAIDRHLQFGFPGLAKGVVAFCWPIRNEYDARHLLHRLRLDGATAVLPVVIAPKAPLVFREWHPGVEMALGKLDIPYPKAGAELIPNTVLLPMNGFDRAGYRLGYGGGFFDRTLEHLRASKPLVIGVSFELAAIDTIHPQPWDLPMDYVVTERGVYRRDEDRLEFLGVPQAQRVELSSPVCYAADIAPGYFGEDPAGG
ncbi:MAG: 5-formyltetrahydrofolate cyclo-ligase [Betaproteobacteria bacterium]|nr:MAG: 5-formyltetrahydrofolate cyclo-ligase [Betaproteobacteria bacterium]